MSEIKHERLVGVIDEGTSTVAFSIYTTPDFKEVASSKFDLKSIHPQDGWMEQDPMEIIKTIHICAAEAIAKLRHLGYDEKDLITIGVTNQRETTVVWDKYTGQPLYNAIIWNDIRTTETVDRILARIPDENKNYFKATTGLPMSPYFSAFKIIWLKDNVPAVRKACRERRCLAGTIDTWIVWNLTKGLHITDVTNASRTMLMNIETLHWDPILLKTFSIHPDMLPAIRSCSEIFGKVMDGSVLNGLPISGIIGNQQASLMGQMCFKPGQAKNTYRSGCFVLCNTGGKHVISSHGLLTTVAYKLGKNAPVTYALEGAVAIGGEALNWLQKNMKIMSNTDEAEKMAESVSSTGDVYFVPAFTGLYAPYWRKDARGIICGLTQFTTKNHIVRATLEAICFQTRDILDCMHQECGYNLNKLHADGVLTHNNLLMQLQADIAGIPVYRSQLVDTTAFGAAMVAALAEGINKCEFDPYKRYYDNVFYDTFLPTTTDDERELRCGKWKKAVERSMGWVVKKKSAIMTNERYKLISSIPAGIYLITVFAMLAHSNSRLAS
ncbi:glycerol kinase [Episyrphus balteatus]|uniref:glycerol kinase n=1 Tax=Episyrphus balteatus TaxID=286459 RepID=UPI002486845A|nr:glycerol kinase [Episyrphus balteatus]XP_055846748.1 glycerol kinase [Episyrphus balteatus]